jgi:hypothetical protein
MSRQTPVDTNRTDARRGLRSWASWFALVLTAAVAVADFAVLSPLRSSGGYQLSLLSGIGTAGLTVLLLAVLVRWPAEGLAADRFLLLGASLLGLAVVYRLSVEVLDNVINANNPPFALPSGPGVDPLLETGAGAAGAWLLALGLSRLGSQRTDAQSRSVLPQVAVLVVGIIVATLVAVSANVPGWAPETRVAVLVSAFGALGWAALARAAVNSPDPSAGRWLVVTGVILTLGGVGLNGLGLLATHRISGPYGSYDTYVAVSVLEFVAWIALCAGFAVLTSRTSRQAPFASIIRESH